MRAVRTIIILLALILWVQPLALLAQNGSDSDRKFQSWLAKRPKISGISIEGNTRFTTFEIKSQIFARQSSFWQSLKGGSRDRLMRYTALRDTLAIKYLYLRDGYINAAVNESYEIKADDSSAFVIIKIVEGPQFRIGEYILEVNDALPFTGQLRRELRGLKIGNPLDVILLNDINFNLKSVYANNGYPYAIVATEIDSSSSPTNTRITFQCDEGPLVKFGNLKVNGLKYYPDYVVRREVTFKPDEIYRRDKIIESQKRLYSTNLFYSLNLRPGLKKEGDEETVLDTRPDFEFSGISRKPHSVSVKTGASQDAQQDLIWDMSMTWDKRNLFGSRQVELLLITNYIVFTQWRPLSHRIQLRYKEPWFMGLRLPMILTAWFEPGVSSQIQPSRIQRYSVDLSTRKEWSEKLYATVGIQYENVNIYGVDVDEIRSIRDTIRVRRKLTFNLIRDSRLDKFVPKSGSYTTYLAQYVGGILGGDDSFWKFEWSWARYQKVMGNAVYATRFKSGMVKEFGKAHSVPTDDRFFLGGANSIRGFVENSIGPRSSEGVNVGGNAYAIFNQEVRFPIIWKFWGSFFTDMGNSLGSFRDFNWNTILFSYGTGIQFISPAGPIRLDYAHRLESGGYSEHDRWHLTILYAF